MTDAPSTPRRLAPAQAREAALAAAQALLVDGGPQAVTLTAVAARIGRTHASLLHLFGSAAGLQRSLATRIAAAVVARIRDAVLAARDGTQDPGEIVRLTFDAFGAGGGGALASWMILSGEESALDPILSAIHALVDELAADERLGDRPVAEETLQLVLTALGDALLGGAMARALGLPRDTARRLATQALVRDA